MTGLESIQQAEQLRNAKDRREMALRRHQTELKSKKMEIVLDIQKMWPDMNLLSLVHEPIAELQRMLKLTSK